MKKRKITITTGQLGRMASDVLAQPEEPIGDHLSDDEFIYYSLKELSPEELAKVEKHLVSCLDCLTQMEPLVEATEAWRGERGEQRLEKLRAKLLPEILASLRSTSAPAPLSSDPYNLPGGLLLLSDLAFSEAQTESALSPNDAQALGGALSWRIKEDKAGNLTISFYAHSASLSGLRLRLSAGPWRRDVMLTTDAANKANAEVRITSKEREPLRGCAPLRLDFFIGDEDVNSSEK